MGTPDRLPTPGSLVGEVQSLLAGLGGSRDPLAPLDRYRGQLVQLVEAELARGVPALEVSRAIAEANDALTRRLLELAEEQLGAPPCRYAWLALGSQGREEQVLSSDQDSAIAYERPRSGDTASVQSYFAALADLVVTALARAGLPLCSGGYMATTWCLPLDEMAGLFRTWVDQPEPQALLQAEVFLDVRACYGALSVETLDRLLLAGGARGPFRVQMARAAVTFRPPFGWFGRLRTENSTLDLKRAGTAAIVLLARLYALAAGSTARRTAARLDAAADGPLGRHDARRLAEAYELLTGLRLRHQVAQESAGVDPDNRIRPDELSAEERSRLRTALVLVRDLQDVTATRFATHTVV